MVDSSKFKTYQLWEWFEPVDPIQGKPVVLTSCKAIKYEITDLMLENVPRYQSHIRRHDLWTVVRTRTAVFPYFVLES